jgi:HD-like signal output (HDOD) protein
MNADPLKVCKTCSRVFENPDDFLKNTKRWRICSRGHLWFNCACESTNMIKKGKFPWYSPDKVMSAEASSVFNQLASLKNLPHLPTHVMLLQQLLQDENTTSNQLAEVTKKAPLLAGKVLDMANQRGQVPGTRIESLAHAITYIGRSAMRDIVTVAGVQGFEFPTAVMDREKFWEDCFVVGRIAEALAARFPCHLLPDETYVAGTLCNIGKLVLAICDPEKADQITKDCQNVKVLGNWQQAEKRHDYPQHTVLGEIAIVLWGLPEYILDTTLYHHTAPGPKPSGAPVKGRNIIALANQIGHWVQLRPTEIDEEYVEQLCEYFGVSKAEVESLADEFAQFRSFS